MLKSFQETEACNLIQNILMFLPSVTIFFHANNRYQNIQLQTQLWDLHV